MDSPGVIVVVLRNTIRKTALGLQDKVSMVGREGMMSSSSSVVCLLDNNIQYYQSKSFNFILGGGAPPYGAGVASLRGVVWCGVVWCGVVWCGVVWWYCY